jgi:hypothetical protein
MCTLLAFPFYLDNGALSLRAAQATTAVFSRHLFQFPHEIYAGINLSIAR